MKKTEQPYKRFLSNLLAAFGKWKITADTIDLYSVKLSKWNLTDDQWSRALSRIIADRPDSDLPSLGVIYEYLKQTRSSDLQRGEGFAWMTFRDASGRAVAVRVRAEGGKWINAPASVKDRGGEAVRLQGNPGCDPKLPEGASLIGVIPDKPYDTDYHPATPAEALEAFRQGWLESGADPAECERVMLGMQLGHRNRVRKSGFTSLADLLLPQKTALPARVPEREAAEVALIPVSAESEFVEEVPF